MPTTRRAAAAEVRQRLDAGGACSRSATEDTATDAMDFVADLRTPPASLSLTPRRALDLTEDSSILSALSNDVGQDLVFARQIGAYAGPNDVAVGYSTSG